MKGRIFLVAFLLVALFASFASALPTVEQVKINGNVFASGDQLVVQRGETLNIQLKLSSVINESNVQVTAGILGYEYSPYVQGLSDETPVFDLNANDTLYKTLTLKVPENVDKDYYDLRIGVGTRTGTAFEGLYRLHLEGARHNVVIKDVLFTPENTVKSGRAMLAVVRVKNLGEKEEQGIKVKVSVPDLGISASDYIDDLKADESTSSEELYLRIPDCAKDGSYQVNVEIIYNDGYSENKVTKSINVVQQDTCKTPASTTTEQPSEKTIVSVPSEVQELKVGTGNVYPITITNAGSTSQTYVVAIEGADWATTKISPSNVIVVKPGETKFAYIYVTPTATAEEGEHVFNVKVTAGDQEKTFSMKGTVAKAEQDTLKRGLEISLIILLIVLIIVGLIVGLSKMKGGSSESEEETSYY